MTHLYKHIYGQKCHAKGFFFVYVVSCKPLIVIEGVDFGAEAQCFKSWKLCWGTWHLRLHELPRSQSGCLCQKTKTGLSLVLPAGQ